MSWAVILLIMLALFALNMRLYLGILAAVLIYFVFFNSMPMEIAVQRFIAPSQNTSLLAIPFFVLLGTLLSYSGVAERIVDVAMLLVGRIRGGLALANILVSMLLGGVSASNLADSAMLTRMMVPEMEKRGYGRAFSAAVTAAGSLVTPIIPPGIALIIYALIADVSVSKMFMAGIIPGLLAAASLMVAAYLVSRKRGYMPAATKRPSLREAAGTILRAWPAVFLVMVIIGGIRFGIFTPTEAGAVAVLLVLITGMLVYRTMRLTDVFTSVYEASKSTASVLLIIMASGALGWIFSVEKAGVAFADLATGMTDSPILFLLLVNVALLLLGMLIEGTALLIILVPLLKPTLMAMGIDPIHFGIIMIFNLSIGTLTPPVGTVMLLVANLARVDIASFTRESLPFFAALLFVLGLIVFIPGLSLFLAG
ncbi:TRAP transporter, DctM subunit [Hoeflea sp. IMCC20628]|uniref:TRAP transporter large permease n=1 Tax=Hoeflea sp. IMCC20628 TaxID=1620421 RepID=UPI00063A9B7B|nr:TRAP transporter large permease [Hoeflea sp. IMCC20628]AKH99679.1 TRAP transporter, DctM subunit [Hoeflea sp. IMCC20628]